jgi:endonuclease/exonuclease/phosphatase family metal-dependent hydrolase
MLSVPFQRSSPDSVLFATYNLLNLFAGDSPGDREHYELAATSIRSLGADVLAVQEIRAPGAEAGSRRLRRLAGDVGLECLVPPESGTGAPRVALAAGPRGYHVGLMWRPGIEPLPGSLRRYGGRDFWHSLVALILDVGGVRVQHASHHATPFGRILRADQNERLVAMLARPSRATPTAVGADWNTESADRVHDPGTGEWTLYEPGDPYEGAEWFSDMVHQCEWDYDAQGRRRHWADRRPGDVLWAGGLHDAAAVLRAPWQATAGHHPADPFGVRGIRRRIDGVRVNEPMLGALRAHHVADTELTRSASDHLPVVVEYLPSGIGADGGGGR